MKSLSAAKTILTFLLEIGNIGAKAFFPPEYARKYGYPHLYPHLYNDRKKYSKEFGRLRNRGLIEKRGDIYRLTAVGEKEAIFARLEARKFEYIKSKKQWDGYWRVVFFDIPEKKRWLRDKLRLILKSLEFREFQKSVWISPFSVPDFLKDVLFEEGIKQYVRFMTSSKIEYDKDIKKMFNLE